MATITINGFIYAEVTRSGVVRFNFFDNKFMGDLGYVFIGPHEMTFEAPDDSDLLTRYAANLERMQKDMRMDLGRIESNLAAIANTRVAA